MNPSDDSGGKCERRITPLFSASGQGAAIKRGDLVLIDTVTKMANKPRAPAADLTWVGYVGETVPEEYVQVWNIVFDAQVSH